MKKFIAALGLASLLIPTLVLAATFRSNENVAINETIEGNLYLGGSKVVMAGNVTGDLIIAGGNVDVTGNVGGDLAAAGGTVIVSGKVNGDVRVLAGDFTLDNEVNGEVVALGGTINLGMHAVIHGDLISSGGTVNIDPATKIDGKKMVYSDEDAKNEKLKNQTQVNSNEWLSQFTKVEFWSGLLFSFLALAVLGGILFGIFPNFVSATVDAVAAKGAFWPNFGIGIGLFFMMPLLTLFFLLSGVGYLLSLVVLFGYLTLIFLSFGFAGILLGGIVQRLRKPATAKTKKVQLQWQWVLGGVLVLHVVTKLPIIGGLIGFVMMMVTIGAIMRVKWNLIRGV